MDVEDAPFVVVRVAVERGPEHTPGGLRVHLSDGSAEELAPEGLWIGPRDTPYCLVKAGRFVARLSLSAWLQLAPRVEEGSEGAALVVGGRRYAVPRRG